ncbi:MAG TPA: class I SAM-dependent methyltransferase [Acidimicrobiia bacterium]|nr:class I SAM-dependent methyltransferase [Acidimicrobiia bacterium]
MTPENPFAAPDVGTLYARGRPFHHPRSLARIRAIVGGGPPTRALDVACGTGMSTIALAAHAAVAVGIDVSPEMLRAARPANGAAFMLASAEQLPFAARSLDAVTCCSGVHWFDQQRFFSELRRVLRPDGWVGLYDHYFLGEMVDVPAFADWTRDALGRFPLPDRNAMVGDPRAATPDGFEKVGEEFFGDDIEMTHAGFADYQLTISNFVAAAERGMSREELRGWLLESTAPLFAGASTRVLRFLGSITCLRPA